MEILIVDKVLKIFGDYPAVNRVSFSVDGGKIFGLLGPNGAGKTTMIRMINNILIPDEGKITIFGEKAGPALQNRIGYLPEERGLYKKIKVIEQLAYFGQLKGLSKADARREGLMWLRKLDAEDWAPKKIQELSKGMQQKVQFISTILHDPDLLILDEPFSGFDPVNVEILKRVILDLKEAGKTIILSTHVMEQAEQMCDEIALINKGKLVLSGALRDIKKSYGRDACLMEFDGDASFLNEFSNIKFLNKSNNRIEFRFDPEKTNIDDIMRAAVDAVKLSKFELVEPSLHEIFIDEVTRKEDKNGE